MRYSSGIATLTALAAALALSACNRSQAAQAAATGSAGSGSPNATLVTVPQNQMPNVQVVKAEQVNWPNQLRLTGDVDYNQFVTTPVLSPVGGPVARISATPGEHVAAGQVLAEISSPDYAQARDTYLKAKDSLDLADKAYKRDQDLYEHQALAQADLEAAASVRNQALADLETAEQSLRILGLPDPSASQQATPLAEIPIKAPIAGEIVERDIAPGQLLQTGTTQCFVISNTSTVWVLANVYQSDLASVHVGDPVTIQTDVISHPFHGRISYLSPALDPNSRTLQARIETANPNDELKKQMYVTAIVDAGTLRNIVAVPDSAVLRDDQNFPFVYVQQGANNTFARRMVSLGQSQSGYTQITSGLAAGEPVVGNGALFVQFATTFQQ